MDAEYAVMLSHSIVFLPPAGSKPECSMTFLFCFVLFFRLRLLKIFLRISLFPFSGKTSGNTYAVIYEGPLSDFPQCKRVESRRNREKSNHYRVIDLPKLLLQAFHQKQMLEYDYNIREYLNVMHVTEVRKLYVAQHFFYLKQSALIS